MLLAPSLFFQGALDWANARRVAQARPPLLAGSSSLRSARLDVAAWAFVVALGAGLIASAAVPDGGMFRAGFGTPYVAYGAAGLTWAAWDLARLKRRRRACQP